MLEGGGREVGILGLFDLLDLGERIGRSNRSNRSGGVDRWAVCWLPL